MIIYIGRVLQKILISFLAALRHFADFMTVGAEFQILVAFLEKHSLAAVDLASLQCFHTSNVQSDFRFPLFLNMPIIQILSVFSHYFFQIGRAITDGERRHNKGCNCKRSGIETFLNL